ncbi:MAG: matrixin family metalloprotease [Ktedonobacteraceae bacterium]
MQKRVLGRLSYPFILMMLAAPFFFLCVPSAFAWTQLDNDYPNVPPFCGGSSNQPCLYWAQPHNSSISLSFYIDPSLYQGGFDFRTAINNSFSQYGGVKAWNPYMNTCYGGPCTQSTVGDYQLGSTSDPTWSCGSMGIVYAFTQNTLLGPVEHTSGLYYQFIRSTNVEFNPQPYFHWHNSITWGGNCSSYNADAIKVVKHESGHVIGLGHTGHTAIMHQGEVKYDTLQSDDITGIQAIYNGNSPSS